MRACSLTRKEYRQLSFLEDVQRDQKQESLEREGEEMEVEAFGHYAVQRGIMLTDAKLSRLDPVAEHTIYPEAFLKSQS